MTLIHRHPVMLVAAVLVLLTAAGAVAATRGAAPERIAFLARADNPVDALAASSVAAQLAGVVLLTDSAALSPQAQDALTEFAPDLVVLAGGTGALSARVEQDVEELGFEVQRVAGASRLDTAAAIVAFLASRPGAFLPVDGTAVRADSASTAEGAGDSLALGGVPASSYGPVWSTGASNPTALTGGIFNTNNVASLEVTIPSAGMLVVHGGASISGGGHGSFTCNVMRDATVLTSGAGVTDPVLQTEVGSCAATGAIAVEPGTFTITLVLRVEEAGHSVGLRNLFAQFTPNGAVR